MVDFYTRKTIAYNKIGELISKGRSVKEIQFEIMETFGFAKVFVNKYLADAESNGFLKVLGDGRIEIIKK